MDWKQLGVARYYSATHAVSEFYPGDALSGLTARGWAAYRRGRRADVHLGNFATMDEAMTACVEDQQPDHP